MLHSPIPQEVILRFNKPWEGNYSSYPTVFKDQGKFKMYYRGGNRPPGAKKPDHQFTCYAESDDGINWVKPNLGIVEFEGNSNNNIVWDKPGVHCFTAFRDKNPKVKPGEEYKAIAYVNKLDENGHIEEKRIMPLISGNGINWQLMQNKPIIVQRGTDAGLDLAFYDTFQEQYVAYFRGWRTHRGGKALAPHGEWTEDITRQIMRATSDDFSSWTSPEFVDFGDTPLEQFYTSATTPYFRAPHIYIAMPKRFMPSRKKIPEHHEEGVSDGVFMSSRDGINFDRTFMEAFLRPGRDQNNWVERSNMISWGIIQTASDEISAIWTEHNNLPTCRLRRGTLRLDGFASLHGPYSGGEMITNPLHFAGNQLILNYATSAAGSIQIEIQDKAGKPIPGYTLAECPELYGDEIDAMMKWDNGWDVSQLAGQPIRLRMVLRDADVYSMRFRS
jgi:hypothetical protein